MYNSIDVLSTAKTYLRKLKKIINEEASFTLINVKILKKAKIDDILCCIEGALPQEYRDYIKKYGANSLKSNTYIRRLHAAIKNRFMFSTNSYAVRYKETEPLIEMIISALNADLNRVMHVYE